jgi:hypothetical protein
MFLWLLLFPCCSFHLIYLDSRRPWDPDFDASRRTLRPGWFTSTADTVSPHNGRTLPPVTVPHGSHLPDQALVGHHQLPCTDWAIGPLPLQLPEEFHPLPRSPLIRKEIDGKQAKVYVNAENLCIALSRTESATTSKAIDALRGSSTSSLVTCDPFKKLAALTIISEKDWPACNEEMKIALRGHQGCCGQA